MATDQNAQEKGQKIINYHLINQKVISQKKQYCRNALSNYIFQAVCYNYKLQQQHTMTHKKEIQEIAKLLTQANESLNNCLKDVTVKNYIVNEIAPVNKQAKDPIKHVTRQLQKMSIFDKIEDFVVDETIEARIINLKLTQFTQRRKDELFKRFKKDQEEKLINKKKEVERNYHQKETLMKLYRGEFTLRNQTYNKTETFPINAEDMQKLKPETDLNDTIIGNYIKLLQFAFLPLQTDQKCHIFSTFFLQKLLCQLLKQEVIFDKDPLILVHQAHKKVKQNYKNVKRWTKKIDIFQKQIVVFPINAFKHWYCIILLRPKALIAAGNGRCELIYCDSMSEKQEFIVQSIRKYIQYQIEDKKKAIIEVNDTVVPCYQLLLPRQTNTHDCGLYMISYIEELLLNQHYLQDLSSIKNRRKLNIFPRTLLYTMRDRLKKLFIRLINANDDLEKNGILADYKGEKERIMKEADASDFDSINQKQYKKYEKMNLATVSGNTYQQKCFACEIKFYLDPQINFYQKDKL